MGGPTWSSGLNSQRFQAGQADGAAWAGDEQNTLLSPPPQLNRLANTPAYDLATVVHLLDLRPIILWQWEQQLGAIAPGLLSVAALTRRYYSDRDVSALLWLRDALVAGMSFSAAAATLLSAQSAPGYDTRAPQAPDQVSGQLGARAPRSQSLRTGDASGRLGVPPGAGAGARGPQDSWRMLRIAQAADLQLVTPLLVRAFTSLDQTTAQRIVQETLRNHTLEEVCLNLFQPALARVGELWSRRQATGAEEHFASSFVKGVLFAALHAAEEAQAAPLVLVGCGPHETHELGALTLAVFWRRAGLRVRYIGADTQERDVIEEALARRPALLALSIMTAPRIRPLARIGKALERMPQSRPIFAYGGAVFARNPKLQHRIKGMYLGDDAATATWQVRRLLGDGGSARNE